MGEGSGETDRSEAEVERESMGQRQTLEEQVRQHHLEKHRGKPEREDWRMACWVELFFFFFQNKSPREELGAKFMLCLAQILERKWLP